MLETKPTVIFIMFSDILMFYQIFFSLQVKRSAIISNKDDIYVLPHELSNDFRFRVLGLILILGSILGGFEDQSQILRHRISGTTLGS